VNLDPERLGVSQHSAAESLAKADYRLVIRDALDRTERSEEIVALVPPAIRRRLVELLFRMYGRGIIELADIE
jgi:hypothetical protein